MWKLVKISQQTCFIYCDFNIKKQEVKFILYDLTDTWSQTLSLNDVKKKVKDLNKRYDFSEDNIKDALLKDALHSASIEEEAHTSTVNVDSCYLKLKYRIKNCLLNYEWTLRKQSLIESQNIFVKPLLVALFDCHQQVEILIESLRKKDLELKQYRIEGAVLSRKTLVTKPFDFDDFNRKYEDCNKVANNFKELAKYIKGNDCRNVPDMLNKNINEDDRAQETKTEEKQNEAQNGHSKLSPRQKKRKTKEFTYQHLEHHLKLRKQGIEYESSQSQMSSSGNSQSAEDTETKVLKKLTPSKKVAESTLTFRRSNSCSPIKHRREYISSEDKTDSENDDRLKTLRERKSTRSLVSVPRINAANCNEQYTKNSPESNKKNNSKGTSRKCVKSLNLSFNSNKKFSQNSLENSNIFDFATDTDDDIPFLKSQKSLQTNIPELSSKDSRKCLENKTPAVETISVESVVTPKGSPSPTSKHLSDSLMPVVIDLSSQLNNIKKELECLEAMRLADLKQRVKPNL